jgi:glycerol-3-phosphate dehydrogenase subunit C
MVTTYDPHDPAYADEADVRDEMTRVFDHCQGCRACVDLCASFPTLFGFVDRNDDHDAGRLTPAEQDKIVDQCFQCKLCAVNCPYMPGDHEWAIDFPRLMLRAEAMRRANGLRPLRQQVTTRVMTGAVGLGRAGGAGAAFANSFASAPTHSLRRKVLAATAGISSVRLLPPYARQRFSTWFRRRDSDTTDRPDRVTVYATCMVEFHDTQIGKDLVRVYERNGIACSVSTAGCCGAPALHAGDAKQFARIADENVRTLAREIRDRRADVVVAEPTCSYVVRHDYPDYCSPSLRADAELVAAHTHDACDYLVAAHAGDDGSIDTDFTGDVPARITYHQPCHLRAQDIGVPGDALLRLTGAEVEVVQQCSGTDGTWGLRAGNEAIAVPMAAALAERIRTVDAPTTRTPDTGATLAGDCSLANLAIAEQTGRRPSHPLSLLARAYGIPVE